VTEGKDDSHDDAAGHAAVPPPGRRLPAATQGVCLLIFAGALAALLFFFPALISLAAPQDAGDDQPPGSFKPTAQQWAGLKVERVISRDFAPRVETEGRIALDDDYSTPIFSPYSGRVTRVMAKAGDRVTAGSPLFAIQSNELAQAENDMISGLATLKTARAQLDLASANELRQHALYLGHGAALKDWQQSRVDLATAEGGLRTAEIAVSAVRSRLAILGLNRADIDAVESAPDPEHLNADSIVRSPIAGTVTQRAINPGQNIVGNVTSQGNAGSVYTIGNLSRLWMIGNARETDAPLFHVGDVTEVHVPAFPDRTFVARISYVAPIIDPNTHRLLVRADIANADLALKPDMLASFVILTGAPAPSLAVPENAIVYEGSDAHVFLADPKTRTLAIRNIVVGEDIGGLVEVERGLTAADSVVTSGAVFIDRALSGGS
jgi:cobalt-zinc-cadmium efflux system membrane fusion protein